MIADDIVEEIDRQRDKEGQWGIYGCINLGPFEFGVLRATLRTNRMDYKECPIIAVEKPGIEYLCHGATMFSHTLILKTLSTMGKL